MERGDFFHAVYRIERKLGKIFADLEPYPLYPLPEYFNSVVHKDDSTAWAKAFHAVSNSLELPLSA
jgi:hypothetical protein